jgi:hypothetical protein
MPGMSEQLSLGAAGQRLGVSGGDIRGAGYTKVTAGRLETWEHEPPAWLCRARARKRRPRGRRIEVSCCACGTARQVRPSLVKGYTYLVCGPCSKAGKQPDVPRRPGMVLVHTFNVAGFFHGYTYRVATTQERAGIDRAAALAQAVFLDAPGCRSPDG